jgi:hypothetical protein
MSEREQLRAALTERQARIMGSDTRTVRRTVSQRKLEESEKVDILRMPITWGTPIEFGTKPE